jgi:hypothetical protein
MTREEWESVTYDRYDMLGELEAGRGERKLRLFACACCRRVWHLLGDAGSRNAVDLAEQYADGTITKKALSSACGAAYSVAEQSRKLAVDSREACARRNAARAAYYASRLTKRVITEPRRATPSAAWANWATARDVAWNAWLYSNDAARAVGLSADYWSAAHSLLIELFNNPFRPVAWSAEWRSDTALAMARQMYESREFGPMPILADALEDAGCDNPDILGHCRDEGPHVRGCWVVDLLLGKA